MCTMRGRLLSEAQGDAQIEGRIRGGYGNEAVGVSNLVCCWS